MTVSVFGLSRSFYSTLILDRTPLVRSPVIVKFTFILFLAWKKYRSSFVTVYAERRIIDFCPLCGGDMSQALTLATALRNWLPLSSGLGFFLILRRT